jgi:ketosteroid isomerase-like protein
MAKLTRWKVLAGGVAASLVASASMAGVDEDRATVAALDIQYQSAVERNDADTIARIHHENMTLVLSSGSVITGRQIEDRAREKAFTFERQVVVDDSRVVRVLGDTAVVTAKLWLKGKRPNGELFDYKLWFSDTYVRTPAGWRYFFGQAGAPLPA